MIELLYKFFPSGNLNNRESVLNFTKSFWFNLYSRKTKREGIVVVESLADTVRLTEDEYQEQVEKALQAAQNLNN